MSGISDWHYSGPVLDVVSRSQAGTYGSSKKRIWNNTIKNEGYKQLAIMVIVQAARDAYIGDEQAEKWLETTALDWLETWNFRLPGGFSRIGWRPAAWLDEWAGIPWRD